MGSTDDGRGAAADEPQPSASLLRSSLTVGAVTGSSGILVGSCYGILRTPNPVIFAVAAGIRWFSLGTIYWSSRNVLLEAWQQSLERRTTASTIAGAVSGGVVAGLTKNPRQIVPSTLLYGLSGFAGQRVYDILDASHSENALARKHVSGDTFLEGLARSKWSPVKPLGDDEYERIMREKILQTDADLALLDEDIAKLKSQQSESNERTSNG